MGETRDAVQFSLPRDEAEYVLAAVASRALCRGKPRAGVMGEYAYPIYCKLQHALSVAAAPSRGTAEEGR